MLYPPMNCSICLGNSGNPICVSAPKYPPPTLNLAAWFLPILRLFNGCSLLSEMTKPVSPPMHFVPRTPDRAFEPEIRSIHAICTAEKLP